MPHVVAVVVAVFVELIVGVPALNEARRTKRKGKRERNRLRKEEREEEEVCARVCLHKMWCSSRAAVSCDPVCYSHFVCGGAAVGQCARTLRTSHTACNSSPHTSPPDPHTRHCVGKDASWLLHPCRSLLIAPLACCHLLLTTDEIENAR